MMGAVLGRRHGGCSLNLSRQGQTGLEKSERVPPPARVHDGWASAYCCFQALPREAISSWGRLGLVLVLYQAQMARGPDSGWLSVSSPARGA